MAVAFGPPCCGVPETAGPAQKEPRTWRREAEAWPHSPTGQRVFSAEPPSCRALRGTRTSSVPEARGRCSAQ